MIPAITPELAWGRTTRHAVCILLAPKERLASRTDRGTALNDVSLMVITVGSIISASTIIAERSVLPDGISKALLTAGTITIRPKKPYTTDGMPASNSTPLRITEASFGGRN